LVRRRELREELVTHPVPQSAQARGFAMKLPGLSVQSANQRCVAVIDDNEPMRGIVIEMLRSLGFTVFL
jgi:hypothetical protein